MRSKPTKVQTTCHGCGQTFYTWPYKLREQPNQYCSRACVYARSQYVEERFWSKVDKSGDCWIWLAGKNAYGYGKFTVGGKANGKTVAAHRFAYQLEHGPIPDGLFVCHKCDNPPCVRAAHLFLGTQVDNLADMVKKGRSLTGEKNIAVTNPERLKRGEAHHNARLTESIVLEARRLYSPHEMTVRMLAERFGIPFATMKDAIQNKSWRHVK